MTGAGDTVIAVIAVCLKKGMKLGEAILKANLAGGLVVQKLGASTVTCKEIGL